MNYEDFEVVNECVNVASVTIPIARDVTFRRGDIVRSPLSERTGVITRIHADGSDWVASVAWQNDYLQKNIPLESLEVVEE